MGVQHHLRLRLHGTRLPPNYTITLRLPPENNTSKTFPSRKRRRKDPSALTPLKAESTDSENDAPSSPISTPMRVKSEPDTPDPLIKTEETDAADHALASDRDAEDAAIRASNAYPGALNSIGSVHQRQWFMLLDRANSGFVQLKRGPEKGKWVRRSSAPGDGFEPFFVRGGEVERSVVTGRLSSEVMEDEGVEGFVQRKGWRGVFE